MELPVKSRKDLNLRETEHKTAKNKTGLSFSAFNPGAAAGNVNEIKKKARQLHGMILETLTNEFSPVNINNVIKRVAKEKPEQILQLAKAVIPKDINVEVEEKRTAPIIIPALNRGSQNPN